jgi:hypothetical protein
MIKDISLEETNDTEQGVVYLARVRRTTACESILKDMDRFLSRMMMMVTVRVDNNV